MRTNIVIDDRLLAEAHCIARRLPLLHSDSDFELMVRHLGLRVP